MKTKTIILVAFFIVAVAQLLVPAKMIRDQENILQHGRAFKFRVAPIDPTNPFRGKYITLYFDENQFKVFGDTVWNYGEPIFVELITNKNGFAKIKAVSKTRPQDEDFVKAKARYYYSGDGTLTIDYPFSEYYMEESKAPEAEQRYNESARDTTQIAYALVKVFHGESALADVLINDKSIREIVRKK
jgi:uncharacterized membrane-anchored protein